MTHLPLMIWPKIGDNRDGRCLLYAETYKPLDDQVGLCKKTPESTHLPTPTNEQMNEQKQSINISISLIQSVTTPKRRI